MFKPPSGKIIFGDKEVSVSNESQTKKEEAPKFSSSFA